jgi:predicted phosphoribosyltransferase
MFRNREDAALQLAAKLQDRRLRKPLVLAIPRGGVVVGAVLARELGADLDVVLSRKLRAPNYPEFAIGAVSESGGVFLNHCAAEMTGHLSAYLDEECRRQLAEITRRRRLFRGARPPASVNGRSVIVTDDGIATGSTMIAALRGLRAQRPHELIVAVPVAPAQQLDEIGRWCDEVVCLLAPVVFRAVGEFYEDFTQVEDECAAGLLHDFAPVAAAPATATKAYISDRGTDFESALMPLTETTVLGGRP